jgi:hypothetical protein
MPFLITYRSPAGEQCETVATAAEAMARSLKLEQEGHRDMVIRDDANQVLSVDDLILLNAVLGRADAHRT